MSSSAEKTGLNPQKDANVIARIIRFSCNEGDWVLDSFLGSGTTAAVCNLERLKLNDHALFQGVRGNVYAHVTEEKVTQDYLEALVDGLPSGKSLTVYCLKRSMTLSVPKQV